MEIKFKNFQIQNVKNSSGVFSGENSQSKWKYMKKSNEGFGTLQGNKNQSSQNTHVVMKHHEEESVHNMKSKMSLKPMEKDE